MKTMKILAICGSLRARSSNLSLLQVVQKLVSVIGKSHSTMVWQGFHISTPNEDSDQPGAPVASFRQQLRDADAVIICTPEYAHDSLDVAMVVFDSTMAKRVSQYRIASPPALVLMPMLYVLEELLKLGYVCG